MTTKTVLLPNKLHVVLRGTKVREQRHFQETLNDGGLSVAITDILKACTEKVIDPGPFHGVLDDDGVVQWQMAASGDRLAAMMRLREASWPDGHLMQMALVCGRCPKKSREFSPVLNLRPKDEDGDLDFYPLTDEAEKKIKAGTPFTVEIDGHIVEFGPVIGLHEEEVENADEKQRERWGSDVLQKRLRILTVSDVHVNDIHRWLDDLDTHWDDELEDAMDELDGGVDVMFETACKKGHRVQGVVPFDLEFWRPHRERRTKRERRRERQRQQASAD